MITSITLENFKCFRKLEVNPRLITVFIGPNGTGKSSVLQALALLKQSVGSNVLRHQGNFLSLANPAEIIPKFAAGMITFRIVFSGTVSGSELSELGFDTGVRFQYGADFSAGGKPRSFGEIKTIFDGHPFEITVPESNPNFNTMIDMGSWKIFLQGVERIATVAEFVGTAGTKPDHFSDGFPNVLATPDLVLNQIRIVPAIRGLVRHRYSLTDQTVTDVSLAGGLSNQEEQMASNLAYSRTLGGTLSELLKRVTGTGLRADTIPPRSTEIKSLTPSGDVNIVAEGFGANALILLFYQLITALRGASIMIEEPESHLHPRAQAELASVLAEEAQAEQKQIIMTTHSEHILGRLLTLVAEKKLSKDELAIYSFEKDAEGVCTAAEIVVTDDGRVVGGLKGFFETELEELDRYMKALQSG